MGISAFNFKNTHYSLKIKTEEIAAIGITNQRENIFNLG
jgi:glycerol kinase